MSTSAGKTTQNQEKRNRGLDRAQAALPVPVDFSAVLRDLHVRDKKVLPPDLSKKIWQAFFDEYELDSPEKISEFYAWMIQHTVKNCTSERGSLRDPANPVIAIVRGRNLDMSVAQNILDENGVQLRQLMRDHAESAKQFLLKNKGVAVSLARKRGIPEQMSYLAFDYADGLPELTQEERAVVAVIAERTIARAATPVRMRSDYNQPQRTPVQMSSPFQTPTAYGGSPTGI